MKEIEKVILNEYNECCKKLYVKIKKLEKYIQLEKEKIGICDSLERNIYNYVEKSFEEFNISVFKIMDKIEKEFKKPLNNIFFNKFYKKNEETLKAYFNNVNIYIENTIQLNESIKIKFYNLKQNLINDFSINIKEKNETIKRLVKLENKNSKILSKIKDVFFNQIGVFIATIILSFFTLANFKKILNFIKTLVNLGKNL